MENLTTDEQIKLSKANINAMINNRCEKAHFYYNTQIRHLHYKIEEKLVKLHKPKIYWIAKGLNVLNEILLETFKRIRRN